MNTDFHGIEPILIRGYLRLSVADFLEAKTGSASAKQGGAGWELAEKY